MCMAIKCTPIHPSERTREDENNDTIVVAILLSCHEWCVIKNDVTMRAHRAPTALISANGTLGVKGCYPQWHEKNEYFSFNSTYIGYLEHTDDIFHNIILNHILNIYISLPHPQINELENYSHVTLLSLDGWQFPPVPTYETQCLIFPLFYLWTSQRNINI